MSAPRPLDCMMCVVRLTGPLPLTVLRLWLLPRISLALPRLLLDVDSAVWRCHVGGCLEGSLVYLATQRVSKNVLSLGEVVGRRTFCGLDSRRQTFSFKRESTAVAHVQHSILPWKQIQSTPSDSHSARAVFSVSRGRSRTPEDGRGARRSPAGPRGSRHHPQQPPSGNPVKFPAFNRCFAFHPAGLLGLVSAVLHKSRLQNVVHSLQAFLLSTSADLGTDNIASRGPYPNFDVQAQCVRPPVFCPAFVDSSLSAGGSFRAETAAQRQTKPRHSRDGLTSTSSTMPLSVCHECFFGITRLCESSPRWACLARPAVFQPGDCQASRLAGTMIRLLFVLALCTSGGSVSCCVVSSGPLGPVLLRR